MGLLRWLDGGRNAGRNGIASAARIDIVVGIGGLHVSARPRPKTTVAAVTYENITHKLSLFNGSGQHYMVIKFTNYQSIESTVKKNANWSLHQRLARLFEGDLFTQGFVWR